MSRRKKIQDSRLIVSADVADIDPSFSLVADVGVGTPVTDFGGLFYVEQQTYSTTVSLLRCS